MGQAEGAASNDRVGGLRLRGQVDRRAGVGHEVSSHLSTIALHDYVDHRALVRLSFSSEVDPWGPRRAPAGPDHLAPSYGVAGGSGTALEDQRIQDLLCHKDAACRGSSCAN